MKLRAAGAAPLVLACCAVVVTVYGAASELLGGATYGWKDYVFVGGLIAAALGIIAPSFLPKKR